MAEERCIHRSGKGGPTLLARSWLPLPHPEEEEEEEALNGEGRTGGGKMEWSCRKKKRRAMRSGHNGQMNAFLFFMR